ncbi:Cytochrome c oxidase subunit 5B-like protein [Dinothrombium tinctorium]|uniref:Cytochrome c oxidase subunit 5B-like protein n=1 Tax=Dinothrombium tinctorium TaxID=1965070 RepID=A0A3S3RN66_9ACAR|nr:Cytochrome c oxidase subunit 5B-like protein [Dinothrombium tinctorium]
MLLSRIVLPKIRRKVSVECLPHAFISRTFVSVVLTFADPIEHATGLEKKMLLLEEKGITDPFFTAMIKRGPSSREKPIQVPSFEDKRLMGCYCEEDATYVNYMWVHKSEPRRCECGYWFQAVDAPDLFEGILEGEFDPQNILKKLK